MRDGLEGRGVAEWLIGLTNVVDPVVYIYAVFPCIITYKILVKIYRYANNIFLANNDTHVPTKTPIEWATTNLAQGSRLDRVSYPKIFVEPDREYIIVRIPTAANIKFRIEQIR